MTEAEWNACTDPQRMLDWLRRQGKLSDRKARLFAVACCRRIWPLLSDERSRRAVEVAERYADGMATPQELKATSDAAVEAAGAMKDEQDAAWPSEPACGIVPAMEAASMCAYPLPGGRVWGADDGYGAWSEAVEAVTLGATAEAGEQERGHQAALLRGIFGSGIRIVARDTPWRTSTVITLALAIYADREFDRLPILADALEEAGCTDAELLDHLRGPGPFVRGDWALDLILGKE